MHKKCLQCFTNCTKFPKNTFNSRPLISVLDSYEQSRYSSTYEEIFKGIINLMFS